MLDYSQATSDANLYQMNELNQLLRDQNRSHAMSATDNHADESITDSTARTPGDLSFDGDGVQVGGRPRREESLQNSMFFSPDESPSSKDRLVEPEMLENMPTKRQSHVLYKGFMSGVHAISPVVHPPTILKLYNGFWDWYDYSS